MSCSALPFPVLDEISGRAELLVALASKLIAFVAIEVATDTAVLALRGWCRNDLDKVAVPDRPDT